jgi:hypothetical protein
VALEVELEAGAELVLLASLLEDPPPQAESTSNKLKAKAAGRWVWCMCFFMLRVTPC